MGGLRELVLAFTASCCVVGSVGPSRGAADPTDAEPAKDAAWQARGTAFLVAPDGVLLTAYHVVAGCKVPRVEHVGGAAVVRLIAEDRADDLALIQGEVSGTILRLQDVSRTGQPVVAAGYSLAGDAADGATITVGVVTARQSRIVTNAHVQTGWSGGALLDQSGNVLGIVSAKTRDRTLAIPADRARDFLARSAIHMEATGPHKPYGSVVDLAKFAQGAIFKVTCQV